MAFVPVPLNHPVLERRHPPVECRLTTNWTFTEVPAGAFAHAPNYPFARNGPDPDFVVCGGIRKCPGWCIGLKEVKSQTMRSMEGSPDAPNCAFFCSDLPLRLRCVKRVSGGVVATCRNPNVIEIAAGCVMAWPHNPEVARSHPAPSS